jgi:hypothetical protein
LRINRSHYWLWSIKFGCVVLFKFDRNFRVPARKKILRKGGQRRRCRPSKETVRTFFFEKETVRTCKAESGGTVAATVPQPSPPPFLPHASQGHQKTRVPSSATFAGHGVTHTTPLHSTPATTVPRPTPMPSAPRHHVSRAPRLKPWRRRPLYL